MIVVDGQDDRIEENEQNDEVFEERRVSEVDQLFSELALVVEQVEGPVVVDDDLALRLGLRLAKAASEDVDGVDVEDTFD